MEIPTIALETEDGKTIVVNEVDYINQTLPAKWAEAQPVDGDTPDEEPADEEPADEELEIAEATAAPWLEDAIREDDED